MSTDDIIEAAFAHRKHWQYTSDESKGDKNAAAVHAAWQNMVRSNAIKTEVRIGGNLKERIDVIDTANATAYEMKASGVNPNHEFNKDIFKVIIYNEHNTDTIRRLVFITGKKVPRIKQGLEKPCSNTLPIKD